MYTININTVVTRLTLSNNFTVLRKSQAYLFSEDHYVSYDVMTIMIWIDGTNIT